LTFLGASAAAWPLAAGAQQPMPVVGLISAITGPVLNPNWRKGLSEMGFVEGRNVSVEARFAQNDYDRFPDFAADPVRRRVTVIVTLGSMPAALAAKAATATIPIVFSTGADPVTSGLVGSLNRPGGNITGIAYMNMELGAKRLGLLYELVPRAKSFAILLNPN